MQDRKIRLGSLFIAFIITLTMVLPVQAAPFMDMSGHWAEQDVNLMSARGIINGDGNGRFFPNQSVSRQESVALMIGLMGKQSEASILAAQYQPEVQAPKGMSDWARGYLLCALGQGLISSDDWQKLDWGKPAERQEVSMWLAKAMKRLPRTADAQKVLARFGDAEEVDPAKAAYIASLVQDGVIAGADGRINPKQSISRAELVTMLSRADASYQGYTKPSTTGTGSIYNPAPMVPDLSSPYTPSPYQPGAYDPYSPYSAPSHQGYQSYDPYAPAYQDSAYREGRIISIDWYRGNLEISENGVYRQFSLASALVRDYDTSSSYRSRAPQNGDWVEFNASGNQVTSLYLYNDRRGSNNSNYNEDVDVYYGRLDKVYRDEITLRSAEKWRGSSSFGSYTSSKTFDAGRNASIYYNGRSLSDIKDLERYVDDYSYVFVAVERNDDQALMVYAFDSSRSSYSGRIDKLDTRNREFELSSYSRTFRYDDGTIIVRNGRLSDDRDLEEDRYAYVWTDGSNDAAFIAVGSSSYYDEDDGLRILKTGMKAAYPSSKKIELDSSSADWLRDIGWDDDRVSVRSRSVYLNESKVFYAEHGKYTYVSTDSDLQKVKDTSLRTSVYMIYDQNTEDVDVLWMFENSIKINDGLSGWVQNVGTESFKVGDKTVCFTEDTYFIDQYGNSLYSRDLKKDQYDYVRVVAYENEKAYQAIAVLAYDR